MHIRYIHCLPEFLTALLFYQQRVHSETLPWGNEPEETTLKHKNLLKEIFTMPINCLVSTTYQVFFSSKLIIPYKNMTSLHTHKKKYYIEHKKLDILAKVLLP